MEIVKDIKSNKVNFNCNNHSGPTTDPDPDLGGWVCGGAVKD